MSGRGGTPPRERFVPRAAQDRLDHARREMDAIVAAAPPLDDVPPEERRGDERKLDVVLDREIKRMLSDVTDKALTGSARVQLIRAGVMLVAVKAKLPPGEFGAGFEDGDDDA